MHRQTDCRMKTTHAAVCTGEGVSEVCARADLQELSDKSDGEKASRAPHA